MATTAFAVPHGFDLFLPGIEDTEDFESFLREGFQDMTKNYGPNHGLHGPQLGANLLDFVDQSAYDQLPALQYTSATVCDAPISPGRNSQQQSSGRSEDAGSPLSLDTSIIYTPASTLDYNVSVGDGSEACQEEHDGSSRSPCPSSHLSASTDLNASLGCDLAAINRSDSYEITGNSAATRPAAFMNPRPHNMSPGARAQLSHASSAVNPRSANNASTGRQHFDQSAADAAMGNYHEDVPSDLFGTHDNSYDFQAFTFPGAEQDFSNAWSSTMDMFDGTTFTTPRNPAHQSFRANDGSIGGYTAQHAFVVGPTFNQPATPAQQQFREQQPWYPDAFHRSQALFAQSASAQNASAPSNHSTYFDNQLPQTTVLQQQATQDTASTGLIHGSDIPLRLQHPRPSVRHGSSASSLRSSPYPASHFSPAPNLQPSRHPRRPAAIVPSNATAATPQTVPLAPRRSSRGVIHGNHPSRGSQSLNRRNKGGRAKHTHLPEETRKQSSAMRKTTACWVCALQRDRCDGGEPCKRCLMRANKGPGHFLGCDRSKLITFVHEFLPVSMTIMHQKQMILDFVCNQVSSWDEGNHVDLYLTTGYGPPLCWTCYEFKPKGTELLWQLQYLQDAETGLEVRHRKYSPPFALMTIDAGDDGRFENYLDRLMHPNHVQDLGSTFYEEESLMDREGFQRRVLDLICRLYMEIGDGELRDTLKDVIRMLIITYIMGHTLTIHEDTLHDVLAKVKLTDKPPEPEEHTSPRLANRQLKFFFSLMRNRIYEKVLNQQQQTFHASRPKEATWLVSFCAMLGFAMVLEEIQRTIQIQADAKIEKLEMTPDEAYTEALHACERIDDRFGFLVAIFRQKYRDKKWRDTGSFGPGTPTYGGFPEKRFLGTLRGLAEERKEHLQSRQDVKLGPDDQCRYTTRLVARFLLPLLGEVNA